MLPCSSWCDFSQSLFCTQLILWWRVQLRDLLRYVALSFLDEKLNMNPINCEIQRTNTMTACFSHLDCRNFWMGEIVRSHKIAILKFTSIYYQWEVHSQFIFEDVSNHTYFIFNSKAILANTIQSALRSWFLHFRDWPTSPQIFQSLLPQWMYSHQKTMKLFSWVD